MDPLGKLNLELDTSVRVAFELHSLEHEVHFCQVGDLFWLSKNKPSCQARPFLFQKDVRKVQGGEPQRLPLSEFASIHMRKDPPFDMSYITATWFLDVAECLVVNSPQALRAFNEKMAVLLFPEACKRSFVAYDAERLLTFIKEDCGGNAIVKPLFQYGGEGIFRLNLKEIDDATALESLRKASTQGTTPRLVQAFDETISQGEVRAFALDGKALAWCLKVPRKGQFLANTRAGATLHSYIPSPSLRTKIEALSQKLAVQGVYFVGFDIIGEEVSEINITSPRLLTGPDDRHNYYRELAKWVARKTA